MPQLNFRHIATRNGGETNNNTVYLLNAIVEQLGGDGQITTAQRLSTHRLTLNSTEDGQDVLALIERLARAEQALLAKLVEVGQGPRNGGAIDVQYREIGNQRPAALPRPAAPAPRLPAPQRLIGRR